MSQEKYSVGQSLLLALAISVCGWALIISGIAGLYYLIVGA